MAERRWDSTFPNAIRQADAIGLTADQIRSATDLLHQQCWCWGADIRRPAGNLLLAYGFERRRAPQNTPGSNQYSLVLDTRANLRLWGFGLLYGLTNGASILLNRYDCAPLLSARTELPEHVWSIDQLASVMRPPQYPTDRGLAWQLAARAFRWIALYEEWVTQTAGLPYRQATVDSWKRTVVDAASMPQAWRALAAQIDQREDERT